MPVAPRLRPPIRSTVDLLVRRRFATLEADGRAGRLTAAELERAIDEYGRQLIPLPDEALELADCYAIEEAEGGWAVDLPLWTREEGRSDLTLSMTLKERDNDILVEIDDLHVL